MPLAAAACTLLLVDLQERLMPAIAGSEGVVANALRLGEAARLLDVPVLATEQNPAGLGGNLPEIAALASRTLPKNHFDATREAGFEAALPPGRDTIVVAGCETHVCVLQTVLGLLGRGRSVALVADAVGSRLPANRDAALARAKAHGADLVTTEMVVFEWLGTCDHPRFREALRLVK
ncbi:MAG TPA: isochorismatase family protein [Beijerinckiaceae bacterium]|nr:isochorismatase family protein [Beijerinckiaceae bacterium]